MGERDRMRSHPSNIWKWLKATIKWRIGFCLNFPLWLAIISAYSKVKWIIKCIITLSRNNGSCTYYKDTVSTSSHQITLPHRSRNLSGPAKMQPGILKIAKGLPMRRCPWVFYFLHSRIDYQKRKELNRFFNHFILICIGVNAKENESLRTKCWHLCSLDSCVGAVHVCCCIWENATRISPLEIYIFVYSCWVVYQGSFQI